MPKRHIKSKTPNEIVIPETIPRWCSISSPRADQQPETDDPKTWAEPEPTYTVSLCFIDWLYRENLVDFYLHGT